MKTEAQTSKEGAKVQLREEKPLVRGRERGIFRGRGRSRGRGRGFAQKQVPGEYKAQNIKLREIIYSVTIAKNMVMLKLTVGSGISVQM